MVQLRKGYQKEGSTWVGEDSNDAFVSRKGMAPDETSGKEIRPILPAARRINGTVLLSEEVEDPSQCLSLSKKFHHAEGRLWN